MLMRNRLDMYFFFFQAEDGIRDLTVTGVQTCALPILRFGVCFCICMSLAATSLSNVAEFSQTRDLPPLKMAASELDTILIKARSIIDAANGPLAQESGREGVKLGVNGYEIEIPHFSLATSVAFPNELFAFSYTYHQSDKPISSVTIDLRDSSRRVSVNGESADKIQAFSNLLEKY